VGLGLALHAPRGHGQAADSRFAFADTTLLRDTLDLKFTRLFPLADSLRVSPDTLRALAIRYRTPIERLVHLADSLRMPVDSVGVVMQRERFNPLVASARTPTAFRYSTTYGITRQTSSWSNDAEYRTSWSSLILTNVTSILFVRSRFGGTTEVNKSRSSSTQLDWKFARGFSMGVRANLQGNESFSPGSIYNQSTTTNEYQFSARAQHQPRRNVRTSFNFFGGPFGQPNSNPEKRGFSGSLDGRIGTEWSWASHDLSGSARGQFGRARLIERDWLGTFDFTRQIRGSLNILSNRPAGLNVSYSLRRDQYEYPFTPPDAPGLYFLRRQPSADDDLTLEFRVRRGSDTYLTVGQHWGRARNLIQVGTRHELDHRIVHDRSLTADGRHSWRGWSLEMRFTDGYPTTDGPIAQQLPVSRTGLVDTTLTVSFRERDDVTSRTFSTTLSRSLTQRLVMRATGSVSLIATRPTITDSSYRFLTGSARVTPNRSPHDDYHQSWRIETSWVGSDRVSTSIALDVTRSLSYNLLASGSASNTETRSYIAEWRWSYRILPGFTATQRNLILANYTYRPYAPDNNRLAMDYLTTTTLNAVLSPRLSIDVTHRGRVQPSGDYTREDDGLDYFNLADESLDYALTGVFSYAPVPALRLSIEPSYHSLERISTVDGRDVPSGLQSDFNLAGRASLNFAVGHVGQRGQLSGNISRNYQSNQSTRFPGGVMVTDPAYETDFWNGSLQFSWDL
jgi:hypothetical protein